MPISSAITRTGSGVASAATRSTLHVASAASSSSCAIARIHGSSRATIRGVNAWFTSERSRACSAPSWSIIGGGISSSASAFIKSRRSPALDHVRGSRRIPCTSS